MSIQVFNDLMQPVSVDFFTFAGGEESVKIMEKVSGNVKVVAKISKSSELVRLLLLSEALDAANVGIKELILPYVPYARQDRRCNVGEAHSLKVFAGLINAMWWDRVVVVDPHSDVVEALFERCRIIRQHDAMAANDELVKFISNPDTVIVSPDAGALKKIYGVAEKFLKTDIVKVDKRRNISNGEITGIDVHNAVEAISPEKNYLIVDDICDGGRTFIEIAKEMEKYGATRISLYVTHGIFSKGPGVFDGLIKEVWTTDSFFDNFVFRQTEGATNVNRINITKQIIRGEI